MTFQRYLSHFEVNHSEIPCKIALAIISAKVAITLNRLNRCVIEMSHEITHEINQMTHKVHFENNFGSFVYFHLIHAPFYRA